ncbi:MAG: hypothetical protein B6241_14695 [Spirochaetaceae bacterium 4572_59]|nr:MAG: hypothetical protein B6241_14695 [Spirochaetaceae bacterium 4572_59]
MNLTLRGKLILTGNEPHTFLMLVCEDNRKYQLTGDLLSEMKQAAPGQTVLVYGFLSEENPGKPLTNSFKLPLFKVNSWDADKINKNLLPERKPGS